MTVTTQMKNKQLLWRSGFGIAAADISLLNSISNHDLYKTIKKKSIQEPIFLDVADNMLKNLMGDVADISTMMDMRKKGLSQEQKKQLRKQSAEDLRKLTLAWLNEMINSEAQLREKMALFWHGHFACLQVNIFYQQQLLNSIRKNALGNFGDLLREVSKSASMLSFLNNQQNRKQHPNENFAREVMELFTLGRGNYTETDVKEAARAFTGWGFNLNGEFVFRKVAHDDAAKTVLGKTGNFDGDDVLNILLEQKQTAKFITRKIYKYFVSETVDDDKVNHLAESFYHSNYNIGGLMKEIFTSKWFYEGNNIGVKIKSPVELITGIRRMLPMQIENGAVLILLQRALGQLLFYPPNVAGWPGGKSWIDSSTLMLRLRIPQLIKDDDTFVISLKANDDQQMGMKENFDIVKAKRMGKEGFSINANVDWETYIKQFEKISKEDLFDTMQSVLLQTPAGSINRQAIESMSNNTSRAEYIKSVTTALMSTPEYQLC